MFVTDQKHKQYKIDLTIVIQLLIYNPKSLVKSTNLYPCAITCNEKKTEWVRLGSLMSV